jgi:hypothetical protein
MVAEYRVMGSAFLAMSMDYDSKLFVSLVYAFLDGDLMSSLVEYHLF